MYFGEERMNKLKEILQNISENVKGMIKKFPVTLAGIVVSTILACICIEQTNLLQEAIWQILVFCIIATIGFLFTETYTKKLKWKILLLFVSAFISFIFTRLLFLRGDFWGIENELVKTITTRWFIGYFITMAISILYGLFKNTGKTLQEYMLKIFSKIFNVTIIYGVLNIGLTLISIIFIQLILDGKLYQILLHLQIILFGLFYIPALLYSIYHIEEKDVNAFMRGLVCYVLLPLVTIAIGIIYLYIAKIMISQEMPSNVIYRILAGIFVFAFPIWNMAENYKQKNKMIEKITKFLPYFYMPLILLEIYSIGTRINEFGFTPSRYLCCIFILFQIATFVFHIYHKKEKLHYIFIVAIVLSIFTFFTPWNYESFSYQNQGNRIKHIMPEGTNYTSLTKENQKKVRDAYQYLKQKSTGEKYIPEYLTEEDKKQLANSVIDFSDIESIHYQVQTMEINVSGYHTIKEFNSEFTEDEKNIVVYDGQDRKIMEIDLTEYLENLRKMNQISTNYAYEYLEENPIIKFNNNIGIYIKYISYSYRTNPTETEDLYIRGYVLER